MRRFSMDGFSAILLVSAAVVLLISSGCSGSGISGGEGFDPVYPGEVWERATPESQGIDSSMLLAMMDEVTDRNDDIDAVVLARNGRIVFEAFRSPYSPQMLHRIYSCTKSINSLLVGIAIDNNAMPGTHTSIVEFFPSLDSSTTAGIPPELTLEHLLTMTTGLDARDSYRFGWSGLTKLRLSGDPVEFALTRPSIHPPGEHFEYSNQASFLLGAAVTEAAGRPMNDWAKDVLFTPLGIDEFRWDILKGGEPNSWGGLWLTGEDLARLGLLVARDGRWSDKRIVSRSWLRESLSPKAEGRDLNDHYGYQWWVSDDGIPMAQGYAGQYLIILPEEDLVMVFLSSLPDREFHRPQHLLREYVLPAITSEPLPENPEGLAELHRLSESWNVRYEESSSSEALPAGVDGTRYVLESNRRDIVAVSFNLDRFGTLHYREEYSNAWIDYPVGMDGEFLVSETDGLIYALAGQRTDDGLDMREYGLGQAYRNDYRVRFPEGGEITVSISDTSGNRTFLKGTASDR